MEVGGSARSTALTSANAVGSRVVDGGWSAPSTTRNVPAAVARNSTVIAGAATLSRSPRRSTGRSKTADRVAWVTTPSTPAASLTSRTGNVVSQRRLSRPGAPPGNVGCCQTRSACPLAATVRLSGLPMRTACGSGTGAC